MSSIYYILQLVSGDLFSVSSVGCIGEKIGKFSCCWVAEKIECLCFLLVFSVSNTGSMDFCLMCEIKCASMLLFNDALICLCFLLIGLQEKYRWMLVLFERREIEDQVQI